METEQGWKIRWDVFHPLPAASAAATPRAEQPSRLLSRLHSMGDRLSSMLPSFLHFGHHHAAPDAGGAAATQQEAQAQPGQQQAVPRLQRRSLDLPPRHPQFPASPRAQPGAGLGRAGSLPAPSRAYPPLDAAPLYAEHHGHAPGFLVPETITEGGERGGLACPSPRGACACLKPHPPHCRVPSPRLPQPLCMLC